jgi:plasmid stability protein
MTSLVIKNLPDELHRQLKSRAKHNHRSMTREAIAILEAGVQEPEPPAGNDEALERLAAAGRDLLRRGVDLEDWAARSRDVWR